MTYLLASPLFARVTAHSGMSASLGTAGELCRSREVNPVARKDRTLPHRQVLVLMFQLPAKNFRVSANVGLKARALSAGFCLLGVVAFAIPELEVGLDSKGCVG